MKSINQKLKEKYGENVWHFQQLLQEHGEVNVYDIWLCLCSEQGVFNWHAYIKHEIRSESAYEGFLCTFKYCPSVYEALAFARRAVVQKWWEEDHDYVQFFDPSC